MFEDQTVELLPARTTMKKWGKKHGGGKNVAVNVAIVYIDVDGNNNDVDVDIEQEANAG